MAKKRYYTIGEIFKGGMLKNHLGEPYAHKSTVSKLVNKLHPVEVRTAFGMGKGLTKEQIKDHNDSVLIR